MSIGIGQPGAVISPTGPITDGSNITLPGAVINADSLGRGFYGLAFQATNFAAMLNFLETQGDVHVLSSPRIATLNNQKALLKVGSDELFVTGVTTNQQTNAGGQTTNSPTLTVTPFFSGIVLDVTPQIDGDGQVMLHVHPSISQVTEREKFLNLGTLGNFRLPLGLGGDQRDRCHRARQGRPDRRHRRPDDAGAARRPHRPAGALQPAAGRQSVRPEDAREPQARAGDPDQAHRHSGQWRVAGVACARPKLPAPPTPQRQPQ